jgi:HAD superfamily hydrolase (TIGR01490 family)
MKLALFDLDNTLLPIDSDHAWGAFTTMLGWTDAHEFKRRNDAYYAQYQAGRLEMREYVLFATEALRRQGMRRAQEARVEFMRRVIEPALRDEALALVRTHQQAGDLVAIVTATNDFVTRPIAERFGVTELIATELALDATGEPTGAVVGEPAFREGKVARVGQWLAAHALDWSDLESSVFYSDSPNDLALLERVSHPVATNPSPALRGLARERGWRILDLFGPPPPGP